MAEILIKNMEMPKHLHECPMRKSCPLVWDGCFLIKDGEKRHKNCPLVEVPPHGDLIHYLSVKNAVIKVLGKDNILWCDIMDEIDKLPIVIEASKERE